jgi:imidazole glycerol-phosphate synthase subunit HisH
VWTPSVPGELGRAHGIIVPGVGHFDATRALTDEWRAAIQGAGVPLLGICVGLQWLFEGSEEAPDVPGLGVFSGRCAQLDPRPRTQDPRPKTQDPRPKTQDPRPRTQDPRPKTQDPRPLKVPHVGWNSLSLPRASRLMAGIEEGAQVYFTHSYAAPLCDDTVATCDYGGAFTAAAERGQVSAVQFHPEKSGDTGLRILANWCGQVRGE